MSRDYVRQTLVPAFGLLSRSFLEVRFQVLVGGLGQPGVAAEVRAWETVPLQWLQVFPLVS